MRKNRSLTTATGLVIPALKSLPVAALLLAGMTACSDENMPGGNETPDVSESTVTVGNNPSEQAHRITFYGKPGTRSMSRAAADFPSVGSEPEIPEGCLSFDSPNAAQQSQDESRKKAYILTGGEGQIELYKDGNVYVTGEVKTHNIQGEGTIYVMKGAKLTLSDGFNNQNGKIVVFGTLETKGGLTIGQKGQVLVKNNLHVKGDLNVEGVVVVNESLDVDGKIQFNNGSGRVKGKCISVLKEDEQRAVDMSGGGELAIRSHLFCEGLYLGNAAQVYLWPNAMAEVTGTTTMTSNQCGFYFYSSENKTGIHALVATDKFHVEGGADNPEYVGGLFQGDLKLKYGELTNCQPAFTENFIVSADDYYIPSDVKNGGCNPGNGSAEDKPFDPISVIDGPTHDHDHLSATCIQPVGGLAYVSFHLNEAYKDNEENYLPTSKHMGCVEVYDVTEDHAQISSWLMNQDFDFNHLLVDGDKLYTTGDTKKYGATLGVVNLTDGKFGQYEMNTEGREEVMTYYNLYKKEMANRGSSGNCIIRDGDYFRIASYQGFQSFNINKLTEQTDIIPTEGSAKHIAQGGGYIVTLNLDQKGVESSTATVTVYNTWGTPVNTFKTNSVVTPIDGKNVIATDGQSIYVALGEKGVEKYSMAGQFEKGYSWIAEKLETNPDYKGKPLANGLAIDENYVYVANGAAGMIVLDKKDMKRVARYSRNHKESTTYSANYVQKVGNLIYIAYGRNGLEIVKMREM